MRIRRELDQDAAAIRAVTAAAFAASSYGHNGEAGIVDALRADGALSVSLVAERMAVVLGDPGYYGRFGFESDPACATAPKPRPICSG
jgi:predicted N-acetyltransferase YhbS